MEDRANDYAQRLGKLIRSWREYAGVTQTELAEIIGVHKSLISYIERGRYRSGLGPVRMSRKIANALEVNPECRRELEVLLGKYVEEKVASLY